MNRISKRITAIVLSLIIAVAIIPFSGLNLGVSATSGDDVVAYARTFIGLPYVSGGKGPDSFDCSGFASYVYAHFGISIPNSTYTIWNNKETYGTVIDHGSIEKAQAGDLIVWVDHVSIYTSNGGCVEALNSRYGVTDSLPVNSHTNGMDYYVLRVKGIESVPKPGAPVITTSNTSVAKNESFTISWQPVSGATSYRVECALGPLPFVDTSVTTTSYALSLPISGTYTVSVYAVNSSGETQSNKVTITVTSSSSSGTTEGTTGGDTTQTGGTTLPFNLSSIFSGLNLDSLKQILNVFTSLVGYLINFVSSFTAA